MKIWRNEMLSCDDGFTGIYMPKLIKLYTLKICAVGIFQYTSTELKNLIFKIHWQSDIENCPSKIN